MPHETSMSAASRKAWNLKVVQRHDPDILCIWEQVSYVMLMQYSSTGWSKTSVEGSLFLFDRRGDPRYGFFILNRSSSQNYMHLLTAEDNLEVLESYVIFRAKGSKDAPVMGLWASDPEHRAHLGDTLLGLHAHIRSGSTEPYYDPAEVYGATQGQPTLASPPAATTSTTNYAPQTSSTPNRGQSASDSGGMQSLNDLFARLSSSASTNSVAPVASTSQTSMHPAQPPPPATAAPNNGSFKPTQAPAQAPPAPSGPLRGQALLDSLFAMASPTRAPASVAQPVTNNLPISGSFTMPQAQPTGSFSLPPPAAPTNQSQTNTVSPAPSKGGDLLAQLFANINSTQPTASTNNGRPSTPPSAPPTSLPADPAIIHSTKVTPEHKKRINTSVRDRRGYATDTSPRPHHYSHHHRMSVFTEDPTASEDGAGAGGSMRTKPRAGRPLVPFQSDTGPVYHPDPTRPHVSNRFPAGENGEEEKVYAAAPGEEDAEDEIFYDGRGNGKGPSPRRQRRRKNGRGAKNGVNLDRGIAADVLMQGIEWDEGVVDKQLFLQSIYALLGEQEFVDQLYNDYKVAQTRQTQGN